MSREVKGILGILIIGCGFMAFVDGVWQPGYMVKSVWKIVVFLLIPLIYGLKNEKIELKGLFKARSKGILRAVLLGVGIYGFILGCYFTIGTFFDFSEVTGALTENVGVNKDNFVFVAAYISFANSLLEEFFFRGFVFMNLRRMVTRRFAYIVSSTAFAIYHVAMVVGWFGFLLFFILFAGLVAGGLIFNRLNESQGNIYNSWFVHMFANFAINTVGFMLFGII